MKRKVLIIVENLPVPFDSRVWKEATSLQKGGYDVTVLCPRGKGYERGHEILEGIRIYRHPIPRERNSPLGYLWEYGSALFLEFFYAWWIYLRHGFHVIQGCNPPDTIFFVALPFNLIGYVGTMSIQDGLDILLDVALHIKTSGRRDIHFTCVGGGPGLPALRKMTKDKGLEDTVTFTGRVPDGQLLEIISTSDVCVNPDKPCEMNDISTMIKVMEYMALGKPIVQFDL